MDINSRFNPLNFMGDNTKSQNKTQAKPTAPQRPATAAPAKPAAKPAAKAEAKPAQKSNSAQAQKVGYGIVGYTFGTISGAFKGLLAAAATFTIVGVTRLAKGIGILKNTQTELVGDVKKLKFKDKIVASFKELKAGVLGLGDVAKLDNFKKLVSNIAEPLKEIFNDPKVKNPFSKLCENAQFKESAAELKKFLENVSLGKTVKGIVGKIDLEKIKGHFDNVLSNEKVKAALQELMESTKPVEGKEGIFARFGNGSKVMTAFTNFVNEFATAAKPEFGKIKTSLDDALVEASKTLEGIDETPELKGVSEAFSKDVAKIKEALNSEDGETVAKALQQAKENIEKSIDETLTNNNPVKESLLKTKAGFTAAIEKAKNAFDFNELMKSTQATMDKASSNLAKFAEKVKIPKVTPIVVGAGVFLYSLYKTNLDVSLRQMAIDHKQKEKAEEKAANTKAA